MKVILTKQDSFSSKKGVGYVKGSYLSLDGSTGSYFVTKEVFDTYSIPKERVLDSSILKAMANSKEVSLTDVEFDQTGRLVSMR